MVGFQIVYGCQIFQAISDLESSKVHGFGEVYLNKLLGTVDGRNPAPPGMVKTLSIMG